MESLGSVYWIRLVLAPPTGARSDWQLENWRPGQHLGLFVVFLEPLPSSFFGMSGRIVLFEGVYSTPQRCLDGWCVSSVFQEPRFPSRTIN